MALPIDFQTVNRYDLDVILNQRPLYAVKQSLEHVVNVPDRDLPFRTGRLACHEDGLYGYRHLSRDAFDVADESGRAKQLSYLSLEVVEWVVYIDTS